MCMFGLAGAPRQVNVSSSAPRPPQPPLNDYPSKEWKVWTANRELGRFTCYWSPQWNKAEKSRFGLGRVVSEWQSEEVERKCFIPSIWKLFLLADELLTFSITDNESPLFLCSGLLSPGRASICLCVCLRPASVCLCAVFMFVCWFVFARMNKRAHWGASSLSFHFSLLASPT